jgi:hypothetical protein
MEVGVERKGGETGGSEKLGHARGREQKEKTGEEKGWVERRGVRIYRQRNKHRKGLWWNSGEHRRAWSRSHTTQHKDAHMHGDGDGARWWS